MNPSSQGDDQRQSKAPPVASAMVAAAGTQDSNPGSLVHPTENDIILGRGALHAGHPGNVRFYSVIDEHIPAYNAAETRADKTQIVQNIYDVLTSVGRFVKEDPPTASCVVIDIDAAKKKISHAIRYRRKPEKDAEDTTPPRARRTTSDSPQHGRRRTTSSSGRQREQPTGRQPDPSPRRPSPLSQQLLPHTPKPPPVHWQPAPAPQLQQESHQQHEHHDYQPQQFLHQPQHQTQHQTQQLLQQQHVQQQLQQQLRLQYNEQHQTQQLLEQQHVQQQQLQQLLLQHSIPMSRKIASHVAGTQSLQRQEQEQQLRQLQQQLQLDQRLANQLLQRQQHQQQQQGVLHAQEPLVLPQAMTRQPWQQQLPFQFPVVVATQQQSKGSPESLFSDGELESVLPAEVMASAPPAVIMHEDFMRDPFPGDDDESVGDC